ncbi:MAG: Na(+)/H(+) antiporter subunit B [Solirubrobacterales bacterium]
MTPLIFIILILLVAMGTAVVLTRDPLRQAMVMSIYGMLLSALFLALQAPDVALSETVVGGVMVPLMIMLALAKSEGKGAR